MEHTRSKDGTIIAYAKTGAGPPLLLVHGATADHTRWSPLLPRLEPQLTVYAMDRRGRGESGDGPAYDLMREAEDVAAVVEAIGEPAFVLGHSYGGLCSLEAALLTDGIAKLVLYEPPVPTGVPAAPPEVPERMQALVDEGEWEAALLVMMREIVRMPERELAAYRELPMWQRRVQLAPTIPRELMCDRTYRFEPERFAGLRVPTLLLLGGDSPAQVREGTERVDAALPDSRIAILPGQQHIAMDLDAERFVREVVGFLLGPA